MGLPPLEEAPRLLARLGVPDEDAAEILAAWPSPRRDPEAWALLERCRDTLVGDLGGTGPLPDWPAAPASERGGARYFHVYAYLAALGDVRRWHAARGIPDDVSWASLADLGAHVALHRRIHGVGGLDAPGWLTGHFRGAIYRLGRLQFERFRIDPGRSGAGPMFWYDDADAGRLGPGFRRGDPALSIHVPEDGPLSPDACDRSLAWARDFFPRHFPEERFRIAVCTSWLLDDQLAEVLPANANIVRFQRRYRLVPGALPDDESVIRFVFRREAPRVDELPRRTRLERAIVDGLRAGRHCHSRTGWLELLPPPQGSESPR
ncbi:MAG TPA: acyltransferase domain-containing protein [Candidatus Limnocylindria bacterium]|nr:acyltransferase domain-containing protein [Candidatus Limnocylindria bacterium]